MTLPGVLRALAPHFPILVETGSFYGAGIERALDAGFEQVYSIEISEEFYNRCSRRFRYDKRVQVLLGKSADHLPELVRQLNHPAVFFLDAHPSGPGTGGHNDLMAKGRMSEFHQDKFLP